MASNLAIEDKLLKVFDQIGIISGKNLAPEISENKTSDESTTSATNVANIPSPNSNRLGSMSRNEKLVCISSILDCLLSNQLSTVETYTRHLGNGIHALILLCDDANHDVRISADETLNKLIKTQRQSYMHQLLYDLFQEIKRNTSARCLCSALKKFGELSQFIKPSRCRMYVISLLPVLGTLIERDEENVQEAILDALPKIAAHLLYYASENGIKELLKLVMPRLHCELVSVRRTTAEVIAILCRYSKSPVLLINWVCEILIDILVPVDEEKSTITLHGVLLSCRQLLIATEKLQQSDNNANLRHDIWCSLFEISLYYSQSRELSLVIAALETLVQILKMSPQSLISRLIKAGGYPRTSIYRRDIKAELRNIRRLSQSSSRRTSCSQIAFSQETELERPDDNAFLSDFPSIKVSEATKSADSNISSRPSSLTENTAESIEGVVQTESDSVDSDEEIFQNALSTVYSKTSDTAKDVTDTSSSNDLPEEINIRDEDSSYMDLPDSEQSNKCQDPDNPVKNSIGDLTDLDESPLLYVIRRLSYSYLLTGRGNGPRLTSSSSTRASVKCISLQSIAQIASLAPHLLINKLFANRDSDSQESQQLLTDLFLYCEHEDPQVKGQACLLLSNFLKYASHQAYNRGITSWAQMVSEDQDTNFADIPKIHHLLTYLENVVFQQGHSSGISVKLGLQSLTRCLPTLLGSSDSPVVFPLLSKILTLSRHNYKLVRRELLLLMCELDWRVVRFAEMQSWNSQTSLTREKSFQERCLSVVIDELLSDPDADIRSDAADTCVALVYGFVPAIGGASSAHVGGPTTQVNDLVLETLSRKIDSALPGYLDTTCTSLLSCCNRFDLPMLKPLLYGTEKPLDLTPYDNVCQNLSRGQHRNYFVPNLHRIVNMITDKLMRTAPAATERNQLHGCICALTRIIETFPMTHYPQVWDITPLSSLSLKNMPSCLSQSATGGLPSSNLDPTSENSAVSSESQILLSHCLSILTSAPTLLDIQFHNNLLRLTSHLLTGCGLQALIKYPGLQQKSGEITIQDLKLPDSLLFSKHCDILMKHLTKLMSIFWHLVEEQNPATSLAKTSLPGLINASPNKKRKQTDGDSFVSNSSLLKSKKEKELFEKESKASKNRESMGHFMNSAHYMRLYDILRVSYQSYKISSDIMKPDRTVQLLSSGLTALCQLLELVRFDKIASNTQELLLYLSSIYSLEPVLTTRTTAKLLRAIFGTNLSSQWDQGIQSAYFQFLTAQAGKKSASVFATMSGGDNPADSRSRLASNSLGQKCLTQPLSRFAQFLNAEMNQLESNTVTNGSLITWLHRTGERRLPAMLRVTKTDKPNLGSYIRLFEPMVIRSLRYYSVTSSETLQVEIIDVLCQLIHLRVNYFQLDSEERFLNILRGQFDLYEQGQFPSKSSQSLVPKLFTFFLLLSYERVTAKSDQNMMQLSQILRYLESIMAGGLDPQTVILPALSQLVAELFVHQSARQPRIGTEPESNKDLEAQKEYLLTFLLQRLLVYPTCWSLLTVILQTFNESEDRWKKLSRQIIDLLLPAITKGALIIDSQDSLECFQRLVFTLSGTVFRPLDPILKVLFAPIDDKPTLFSPTSPFHYSVQSTNPVPGTALSVSSSISIGQSTSTSSSTQPIRLHRWMATELCLLRVCLTQVSACSSEDILLNRISELQLMVSVSKRTFCERRQASSIASASDNNQADGFETSPETLLARLLFQLIGILSSSLLEQAHSPISHSVSQQEVLMMLSELSSLLLTSLHIFHSDVFRRTTAVASKMMSGLDATRFYSVEDINSVMYELGPSQPYLLILWSQILICLDYRDTTWWSKVLQSPLHPSRHLLTGDPTSSDEDFIMENNQMEASDDVITSRFVRSGSSKSNASNSSGLSASTRRSFRRKGGIRAGNLNEEVVRRAVFLLYCEYICDQATDAEKLSWIIVNHTPDLIANCSEPIVQDLMGAIHRNSSTSGLFIQAFNTRCCDIKEICDLRSSLRCMEALHLGCSGRLVQLLVDKFLLGHCLSLVRKADTIACQRVEMLLALKKEECAEQLTPKIVDQITDRIQSAGMVDRFPLLCALLNHLKKQLSSSDLLSFSADSVARFAFGEHLDQIEDIEIEDLLSGASESWLFNMAESAVNNPNIDSRLAPRLLQNLSSDQIKKLLQANSPKLESSVKAKGFRKTTQTRICPDNWPIRLLEQCLRLGFVRTLDGFHYQLSESDAGGSKVDKLFDIAHSVLLTQVSHVTAAWSRDPASLQCSKHVKSRHSILRGQCWEPISAKLREVSAAVNTYLSLLKHLPIPVPIPDESVPHIVQLMFVCVQYLHQQPRCESPVDLVLINLTFDLILSILNTTSLASHVEELCLHRSTNSSWHIGTVVDFIYHIVFNRLLPLSIDAPTLKIGKQSEAYSGEQIWHLMQIVLSGKLDDQKWNLKHKLKLVIIGLCRLSSFSQLVRQPLHHHLSHQVPTEQEIRSAFTSPTTVDLQSLSHLDRDQLACQVARMNSLGWTTKQVFEETWMLYLTILNQGLELTKEAEMDRDMERSQPISPEELVERSQCLVSGLRGVTQLLLSTMSRPLPGNPLMSRYDHRTRDKLPGFLHTRLGSRLSSVHMIIEDELHFQLHGHRLSICPLSEPTQWNLEREANIYSYGHGQLNLDILTKRIYSGSAASSPLHATDPPVSGLSDAPAPLDVISCIQSIPILHHQWLHLSTFIQQNYHLQDKDAHFLPLALKSAALQSAVLLADMFTARDQLQWLMDVILTTGYQVCGEDDPLLIWLTVGLAKCVSVLDYTSPTGLPTKEPHNSLIQCVQWIEFALKNPVPAIQDAGLQSAMLLLQVEYKLPLIGQMHAQVINYLEKSLFSFLNKNETASATHTTTVHSSGSQPSSSTMIVNPNNLSSTNVLSTTMGNLSLNAAAVGAAVSASATAAAAAATGAVAGPMLPVLQLSTDLDQHKLTVLAATFFYCERYPDALRETDLLIPLIQFARFCMLGDKSTGKEMSFLKCHPGACSISIYLAVIRGLERLLLTGRLPRITSEVLTKLSLDRLRCSHSPVMSLPALGLFLTCIYTTTAATSSVVSSDNTNTKESGMFSGNEEAQLIAMERINCLHERLRHTSSSSCLPIEARLLVRVLPHLMLDFFPEQEALNKAIGEFVSGQQAYPVLTARLLYEIFLRIQSDNKASTVHEWVLLSMRSLVERTPLAISVWSSTIFLLAASSSIYLRAAFSQCLHRYGQLDKVDIDLLCRAGLHFVMECLSNENDRDMFVSIIERKVSHIPYRLLHSVITTARKSAA